MYGWSVEGVCPAVLGLLLSSSGALRSFTTATFFSLVPLQMSDSRAPRPLLGSPLPSRGGLLACREEGDTESISSYSCS